MPLLMCPNDNTPMQEIDRNGVMIDVCPQCRGVWMDRGELEKLLDLVGRPTHDAYDDRRDRRPEPRRTDAYSHDRSRSHEHRHHDHDDRDPRRKKRKRGFDLFDFFD